MPVICACSVKLGRMQSLSGCRSPPALPCWLCLECTPGSSNLWRSPPLSLSALRHLPPNGHIGDGRDESSRKRACSVELELRSAVYWTMKPYMHGAWHEAIDTFCIHADRGGRVYYRNSIGAAVIFDDVAEECRCRASRDGTLSPPW